MKLGTIRNKIPLSERTYSCECGYSEKRDVHAARNILNEGMKQLPTEYRNVKPVEILTSDTLSRIQVSV